MKYRVFFILLLFLLIFSPSADAGVSVRLPHVSRKMTQEVFWLGRLPEADKILLTPQEIDALNHQVLSLEPGAVDVTGLPEIFAGLELHRRIQEDLRPFHNRTFYAWDSSGQNILFGTIELELLKDRMRLKEIPKEVEIRFGLIVRDSDLRSLPVREGIFEQKRDRDFDLVQQTKLPVGTPVAVLWENEGGTWLYLVSSLLEGWVEKDSIGFFENQTALTTYLGKPFLVVTAPVLRYTRVFKRNDSSVTLTMGTLLHGYTKRGPLYLVDYPFRDMGGALFFGSLPIPEDEEGVHQGFLPLTRANILHQAFLLEGAPYGWGGLQEGYDCSSFLQTLFQTMGLALPRNSVPQSNVGKILADFSKENGRREKERILDSASPLMTFLKLDGHIMLYLGKVKERYYVIHATSGYQTKSYFREKKHRLMAVVVSDLSLGEGGRKGSLFKRIVSINTLVY